MKPAKYIKSILVCLFMILVLLLAASLLDILLAAIYARFYSNLLFSVIFGIAGVFGAVVGYVEGMRGVVVKNNPARWTLIATIVITGLLFFFVLSKMESGEYETPFKAFGATLVLGSLFFVRGKVDV